MGSQPKTFTCRDFLKRKIKLGISQQAKKGNMLQRVQLPCVHHWSLYEMFTSVNLIVIFQQLAIWAGFLRNLPPQMGDEVILVVSSWINHPSCIHPTSKPRTVNKQTHHVWTCKQCTNPSIDFVERMQNHIPHVKLDNDNDHDDDDDDDDVDV